MKNSLRCIAVAAFLLTVSIAARASESDNPWTEFSAQQKTATLLGYLSGFCDGGRTAAHYYLSQPDSELAIYQILETTEERCETMDSPKTVFDIIVLVDYAYTLPAYDNCPLSRLLKADILWDYRSLPREEAKSKMRAASEELKESICGPADMKFRP